MMTVLITGGAGYLGSVLVERFIDAGYGVTVVDNLSHRHASLLHLSRHKNFQFVPGDVCDESLMQPLIKSHDVLVPLAALVGAGACERNPVGAREINLRAVELILKHKSPAQLLLFPNTNSGYGATSGSLYCTEESPLEPISIYGQTKVEAEKRVLSSPNSISFRFATLFGISSRMRLDLMVNDFVYRALKDHYLVIFEKTFKRNFLHVRDAADVFLFALERFDGMKGSAYNVGLSEANMSKEELAYRIKKFLPRTHIHFAEIGTDPDKRNYIVSNEKINKKGFVPKTSLDDGIEELIRGYATLPLSTFNNA